MSAIGIGVEAFDSKIVEAASGCWTWTASTRYGYGKFSVGPKSYSAHRFAYEAVRGAIEPGMQIDHLCHNESVRRHECEGGEGCAHRRCVNPDHLAAVSPVENVMASPRTTSAINASKTHCPQGHPYSHKNSNGFRACKTCLMLATRRHRSKQAA